MSAGRNNRGLLLYSLYEYRVKITLSQGKGNVLTSGCAAPARAD